MSTDFSHRVRERRLADGLSQVDLAERAGISRNYLSQIERGVSTNLSQSVVRRISEALGLELPSAEVDLDRLPEGLRDLAEADELPPGDVAMLARIEYRGERPRTPEQWRVIYETIRSMSSRR